MVYDVNNINCKEEYTVIKNKLKRKDFVTYSCRKCGTVVNKRFTML
jgi:transposase-like protein